MKSLRRLALVSAAVAVLGLGMGPMVDDAQADHKWKHRGHHHGPKWDRDRDDDRRWYRDRDDRRWDRDRYAAERRWDYDRDWDRNRGSDRRSRYGGDSDWRRDRWYDHDDRYDSYDDYGDRRDFDVDRDWPALLGLFMNNGVQLGY